MREYTCLRKPLLSFRRYDASTFRFSYSSPVTPRLTCEADAVDALRRAASDKGAEGALRAASWDKDVRVLKRKEAPNCNLADYATTRVFARSRDGRTQVGGCASDVMLLHSTVCLVLH